MNKHTDAIKRKFESNYGYLRGNPQRFREKEYDHMLLFLSELLEQAYQEGILEGIRDLSKRQVERRLKGK